MGKRLYTRKYKRNTTHKQKQKNKNIHAYNIQTNTSSTRGVHVRSEDNYINITILTTTLYTHPPTNKQKTKYNKFENAQHHHKTKNPKTKYNLRVYLFMFTKLLLQI